MSGVPRITTHRLNTQEFRELLQVTKDPFFFATFIWIIHQMRGRIKFDLYPFQKSVLYNFITERFLIILKFRQAGITELISLYCLWLAMYHPNKTVIIISIKEVVAKKVLRKIKFMYRNLPNHLKVPVINGRSEKVIGTATEMEFSNGSTISSIPTTEEAGRSESVALLVIDEAAIVRWASQIMAAAFPTLSTGGSCILNSTPYGVGNFFHKTWVDACARGNPFTPIRLRWRMHPERDMEWYMEMRRALGPRRTAQEIDGDFLTSGASVFDLVDIRAIEETLTEYKALDIRQDSVFASLQKYRDGLLIFNKPKPTERYSVGADVATGRSRDYSAFTLYDSKGEEAAVFKAKVPINRFAHILANTGKIYNRALLAPEANDIGLAVATKLEAEGYPNLYYSKQLLKKKGENKVEEEDIVGWYTTKKNRPVIIATLEEDIRLGNIKVKDPYFVQEAYTFIYDQQNKPVAMGKKSSSTTEGEDNLNDQEYTDDAIMAKSIANHIRKGRRAGITVLPR